mmetsp:Transcript_38424/g.44033  ORF Transcript_38424/g.44033 Transcript_38424/m.44033 type:complete len:133 (-) Transcript_38424:1478-1876(-)
MTSKQLRYVYFTSREFYLHPLIETVNNDKITDYFLDKEEQVGYMNNLKAIHENDFTKRNSSSSSNKVPKVIQASMAYEPIYDNENLLVLFDDIILSRSMEDPNEMYKNLPTKHGEDIMENVLSDTSRLINFE